MAIGPRSECPDCLGNGAFGGSSADSRPYHSGGHAGTVFYGKCDCTPAPRTGSPLERAVGETHGERIRRLGVFRPH